MMKNTGPRIQHCIGGQITQVRDWGPTVVQCLWAYANLNPGLYVRHRQQTHYARRDCITSRQLTDIKKQAVELLTVCTVTHKTSAWGPWGVGFNPPQCVFLTFTGRVDHLSWGVGPPKPPWQIQPCMKHVCDPQPPNSRTIMFCESRRLAVDRDNSGRCWRCSRLIGHHHHYCSYLHPLPQETTVRDTLKCLHQMQTSFSSSYGAFSY